MKLGEESKHRRLLTVELIPDRVVPPELASLKERVDAITIPALKNGSHDPSYPTEFHVTPQQRSIASALFVRRNGIEAVPSLTCRDCRLRDLPHLSKLVEMGLENFLIVFGDRFSDSDRGTYEFKRTEHLIRRVDSCGNGDCPSIGAITNQHSPYVEREILKTLGRVEAGADYVLTNTAFDYEKVLDYRDALRSAGLNVPLFIQISIPQSLENLRFVSEKLGIPVPGRVLQRLRGASPWAGVELAAEAYEALRSDANAIHFSYLLRKRNPIPVYSQLLDRIGIETELEVPAEPAPKLPREPVISY